eukprot:CAMPEP_0173158862 /NCGR_PEP_ID=MMETSP1105-20130129/16712_1 /TAXON_ID=2985 /ORGANISM="Ochromonas sp., Strain BG-1" /LENGTH=371 /DNA_ID=CAMNT_0014077077 /DNA_START=29 /DNA_END=1144 /DNA_ORIENTATION=+
MASHNDETKHPIAFSFSDGSAWCYDCDSYIYSNAIRLFAQKFQSIKFPDGEKNETMEETIQGLKMEGVSSNIPFPREVFIDGLKTKKYHKVSVLTGAGISVAAGIPDFRTPVIGLYAKVAKYGLPYPELVFNLDYFKTNPYPFYQVSKEFLNYKVKPVAAHRFIKQLEENEQLFMNYTQNIDGLELDIGLSSDKLIQAHGHMRSAHCLDCRKEFLDMKPFYQCLEEDRLWLCENCNPEGATTNSLSQKADNNTTTPSSLSSEEGREYKGLIKPDIVFFGESLPSSFHAQFHAIQQSDLIIVMGTSLKVYPFALLLEFLPDSVPVVLINRENPGISRNHFLFLSGDIQDTVAAIAQECGWDIDSITSPLSSE